MTQAGFIIVLFEFWGIHKLFKKHFPNKVTKATIEEFIYRAPLEDVLRLTVHQRCAFFGLCLMTMGRLFNV